MWNRRRYWQKRRRSGYTSRMENEGREIPEDQCDPQTGPAAPVDGQRVSPGTVSEAGGESAAKAEKP